MVQVGVESEDGWRPAKATPDLLEWITVPGTAVTLQLMKGWPSIIMKAYAADYNAFVEPLRDADSAGFTPTNSVATSNHLNGTAMDLNWNSHPFQVSNAGYTSQMITTMREILDFYEDTMWWAQDWDSPKDCMHHQMSYNTWNNPRCQDFINRKIRPDGFSTYRRGGTPIGGTTPAQPAQPAQTDAVTALYDAVPIIDEDRAAQLVDAVSAGLVAAQCTNVKRIAMYLAQCGHESDGFKTTQEYGDLSGAAYYPFIGRTWIQITWQSNYAAFGQWCVSQGLIDDPNQFVNNPASLADLKWAGIGAAWYWSVARPTINALCDQGDVVGVTQLINGGQNGIADRTARYNQALALGDELLALLTKAAPTGGTITLADIPQDEWNALVADVKEIRAQLNGDGTFDTGSSSAAVKRVEDAHASGKPMSLLDIATWLKNHVSTHKAPTP